MFNPRISVVVLTHNRIARLLDTLKRLRALPERPRIIVADNASEDGTALLVGVMFPDVLLVPCKANLGAAARNWAVGCVQTEYVAFCDDDTQWTPGSLDQAVRVLDACPHIGILNARIETGATDVTAPDGEVMLQSRFDGTGLPGPSLVTYRAGACVMRTSVFRETGGYEPRFFIGGEEERVALDVLSAGYAIVRSPAAVVAHRPSPVRDRALQRRVLARNAAWTAWQRLPLAEAWRATARAIRCFRHERTLLADSLALLGGMPWCVHERRRVPDRVLALRAAVNRNPAVCDPLFHDPVNCDADRQKTSDVVARQPLHGDTRARQAAAHENAHK
ncbi:glycosyltransferase family 2 protein [Paraburkholderia solisilvae]|uniref:Glycosyltransferase 2-like domain-containing protein n=1 Tax=Paraburkholderia solisilvae TaxID=624376 RepID=A0A6J5F1U5_9BURK|nr:glycosyltransferase [Paraburkholderia solisilvae]CAB3771661.1 hypothetical protein LMG29739_06080 [Paraburkholderia solisilvae]